MLSGSDMVHKLYQHITEDEEVKKSFEEDPRAAEAPAVEAPKRDRASVAPKARTAEAPAVQPAPAAEPEVAVAAEGKVPNVKGSDAEKIKALQEGFVIFDRKTMAIVREGKSLAVFESKEAAEAFAKKHRFERYQVVGVAEAGAQPKIPGQSGKLPASAHNRTEKIPNQAGTVDGTKTTRSQGVGQSGTKGGPAKAANKGPASPEGSGTKIPSAQAGQGNRSSKEASQREMISDAKVKEYAEKLVLIKHLKEEAKSRDLKAKEVRFIERVSSVVLTDKDRARVQEMYGKIAKKYTKKKK